MRVFDKLQGQFWCVIITHVSIILTDNFFDFSWDFLNVFSSGLKENDGERTHFISYTMYDFSFIIISHGIKKINS
jgi:hypothetical protein